MDEELLEEFLTIKRGSKVFLKVPKKGEKKDLLELVKNNAKLTKKNKNNLEKSRKTEPESE